MVNLNGFNANEVESTCRRNEINENACINKA